MPANLTNAISVSAGYDHTLALRNDVTVVAWGTNDVGQTNIPANLGAVVVWGLNLFGQTNAPADLTNITAIAAGGQHSLALRSNGTAVAWGYTEGNLIVAGT